MKNSFERRISISELSDENIVDFTVPQLVAWLLGKYKNDPLCALTSLNVNGEIGQTTYVQTKMILEGAGYAKVK